MCLRWEIEDLSLHLIHSRKLNIKAVVTFYAVVDELSGIRLPVSLDDETVSVQKKQMRLLSLAIHKKDTLRLKEEVELVSNKPNIAELLWYTLEVRGLDLRPEENVVKAKGELFLFALYKGDDEDGTLQWLEHSIPFTGEVECSGCTFDMVPNLGSFGHQSERGGETGFRRRGTHLCNRYRTGVGYPSLQGRRP